MEKKNHLFDESIEQKIEKQRGKRIDEEDVPDINWKTILMTAITILFAVSILLRIFMG